MGRQAFGTHMVYRETFLQIQTRLLQHLIRRNWIHGVLKSRNQFTRHRRGRMRIKHQFKIRDASVDRRPKVLSSPVREDSSKNYGADQQRLQISDPHFDKFPTPATFACWKIRFKTEVCTCSQFPTEAMLWIKEVEMVDSVDDLKSSSSVRGIRMPDLKYSMRRLLQHWTESSITPASWMKGQSGQTESPKRGPFPSRKTDCLLDLRVLPGHWSQGFRREVRRPIYYFSSKWWYSGIRFEVGWNIIVKNKSHLMTSWKDCTN